MDKQTDDGQMDGCEYGQMDGWKGGRLRGWKEERMEGCMDDGWMERWMGGRMDGKTHSSQNVASVLAPQPLHSIVRPLSMAMSVQQLLFLQVPMHQ